MPCTAPDQLAIDRTASIFVTPSCPQRLKEYQVFRKISTKMIIALRDPTERVISHYLWDIQGRGNGDRSKSFTSEAFQKYVMQARSRVVDSSKLLVQRSIYYNYMKEWLKVFPLRQFLIVKSEDFLDNPVPILQDIEIFLNLQKNITEDSVYFNQTRGFFCAKINNEPTCLRSRKGRTHPQIEPWIIEALRKFYEPYNEMLYTLIQRNMGW